MTTLHAGLELVSLPDRSSGPALGTLLPPVPRKTGRPRSRELSRLGGNGAAYVRAKALSRLAASWRPLPREAAIRVRPEGDFTKSRWFRLATSGWTQEEIRSLLCVALHRARINSSPVIAIRDDLWLDLDWWAFSHQLSPSGDVGVGRPTRPVNGVKRSRADARMSIAVWDIVNSSAGTSAGLAGSPGGIECQIDSAKTATLLELPSADTLGELIAMNSAAEVIAQVIEELESQAARGRTEESLALLLAGAETRLLFELNTEIRSRATVVMSRASADNPRLNAYALPWLAHTVGELPPSALTETVLNLSVAAAARRRFGEAEWLLGYYLEPKQLEGSEMARFAIGQSAWRRRLLARVIEGNAVASRDYLSAVALAARRWAEDGLCYAEGAVPGGSSSLYFRAAVRVAEASVMHVRLAEVRGIAGGRSATDRLKQLTEKTEAFIEEQSSEDFTPYDLARRDVIRESLAEAENRTEAGPVRFDILDRADRYQRSA